MNIPSWNRIETPQELLCEWVSPWKRKLLKPWDTIAGCHEKNPRWMAQRLSQHSFRAGEWHCKLLHRATLNLTYFTFYWLFWVSFSLPLRWKKTIMILYCLELGFLSSRLLTSRSSWAVFLIFLFRSFPFFHYTTHNYKQNERCCNMLYKRLNVCFRAFSFLSLH